MKKFKLISSILLLVCSIFLFASWQYRLFCLLLVVIINHTEIKCWFIFRKWKYSYAMLVILLSALVFCSMPNYFQRGRTQLHYLNEFGKRAKTPVLVYLANVFVPEKEAMNICLKVNALVPHSLMSNMGLHIGGKLLNDAKNDFWRGRTFGFYTSYYHIDGNPGSFVYGQIANMVMGTNYDAVYITRPKHYDATIKYPVIFFCHGYMGSWELYQGILSQLDDCIVVSIGTRELDGLTFNISDIFNKYLPYIQSLGYNMDNSQLHIMGLSNGGQASNSAFRSYDNRFKTITFISTPCNVIKDSQAKILMVGGGNDGSSVNLPKTKDKLTSLKTKCAIYFDKQANHYIFAYQQKEIIDFFNKNL